MTTSKRKLDHIRICLERSVESDIRYFDDLALVHKAMPEICEAKIDTSCSLGEAERPLISAMTGGHPMPGDQPRWQRHRR
jgi:isopentenyl-diphosphate delta-isomerase